MIRIAEIVASTAILRRLLPELSPGTVGDRATSQRSSETVSGVEIVEGWRGTITHRVELGASGILTRVKVVDRSFFNWPALPVALADTIVPDFPLTDKSFNLSYAGNDL